MDNSRRAGRKISSPSGKKRVPTTVAIDPELKRSAIAAGLNLSRLLENAISREEQKGDRDNWVLEINNRIEWLKAQLIKEDLDQFKELRRAEIHALQWVLYIIQGEQ